MTYEQFKHLKPSAFKRRCGVQPETFEQRVSLLRPDLDRRGKRGGQCKLKVEDPLLLVLEALHTGEMSRVQLNYRTHLRRLSAAIY